MVKPWEMQDVRAAAREALSAATRNGGWWTLAKTERGTFIRYAKGRTVAVKHTPLLHVFYGLGAARPVIQRAYFGG